MHACNITVVSLLITIVHYSGYFTRKLNQNYFRKSKNDRYYKTLSRNVHLSSRVQKKTKEKEKGNLKGYTYTNREAEFPVHVQWGLVIRCGPYLNCFHVIFRSGLMLSSSEHSCLYFPLGHIQKLVGVIRARP